MTLSPQLSNLFEYFLDGSAIVLYLKINRDQPYRIGVGPGDLAKQGCVEPAPQARIFFEENTPKVDFPLNFRAAARSQTRFS